MNYTAIRDMSTAHSKTNVKHNARRNIKKELSFDEIRGCIQKFPDWPPGARNANGIALFH
jgi:hypothetical protein